MRKDGGDSDECLNFIADSKRTAATASRRHGAWRRATAANKHRLRGDGEQGKPVLANELRHRILFQQQRPAGLECQHAHAAGGAHFKRARAHARDVEAKVMLLLRDLHGDRAAVLAGEFTAAGEGPVRAFKPLDREHGAALDHDGLADFEAGNLLGDAEAELHVGGFRLARRLA